MKIKKSDFTILKEAERNGMVVSMTGIVEPIRTELNNELSKYFRGIMPNYNGSFDEHLSEDVLYVINEYIEKNKIDKYAIDFPLTEGTDIHLIPITDNLQLKLLVADEYYGSGEYAKYVMADYFVINENTTTEDVDRLINFVNEYLN